MALQITTRPGKDADWGFVLATWLRTFPLLGERETRLNHMRRALGRGQLTVACSTEDPDTLVGWALAEEGDLLWMYVSKDFRKTGIAKQLHGK